MPARPIPPLLERLRALPEERKRRVAVGGTFIITGFIFALWLTNFIYSLDNRLHPEQAAEALSPFQQLMEQVKSVF